MNTLELDVNLWAEQQFGQCDLGDRRRTRRAIQAAAQFAANPNGSTPKQTESWSDCEGVYRLFHEDDVTFQALTSPHFQKTRACKPGHYLLLGDTTTVDFGLHRKVEGLKPVGDGHGLGFLLHSSLMVTPEDGGVVGMAGQLIYYREPVPENETPRQRLQRDDRESRIWGDVVGQVGPAASGVHYTHVFDRGADNFEVYCRLVLTPTDWVVRAAQLKRIIQTPHRQKMQLRKYLAGLPVAGTYELEIPARREQSARTASVEVRFGTLILPRPREYSPFVGECGIQEVSMFVVEVREVAPPANAEPLHWVLLTSHEVQTFDQAWAVIGYYERRPIIEEYHKALKTGCRLEERQYRTHRRLEAVTGMLSILAVRLLQLRTTARRTPERRAAEVVPRRWLEMLRAVQKGRHRVITTVYDFYRALARLGGFLGRKCDGEPGWLTLWQGFEKLHLLLRGADAMKQKCV
jgi:Transposase DNA-binding/Transposase Tn5 dimerisation domain